jgi:hypothetical protein
MMMRRRKVMTEVTVVLECKQVSQIVANGGKGKQTVHERELSVIELKRIDWLRICAKKSNHDESVL